jgi:hypothetical protein
MLNLSVPIIGIAGQFGQFVCAVSGGGKRLLKLFVSHAVIPADSHAALCNVYVFGGVGRGFPDNVGARGRG